MLISSRPHPVALSSTSNLDSSTDHSYRTTKSSSLIPPTALPKHFNVPFAIQHGYFRCIRYLLELNYDPNERDSQLRTPLILCSYIEDDRWSLSLAQNLLEKGAKVALGDHARRNALHHACALQRIHLVQLFLSCIDFHIEAKDCEGNTCLHYVAITGNCDIAELLMKAAEKLDVRLDQCINRDDCSAAVLALKYGHIECANQITHRDWDEFFVIPRPLSIYESSHTRSDDTRTQTSTTISRRRNRTHSSNVPTNQNADPSSNFSFGLLKIIFNEGDSSYSTRLAGLCNNGKQNQNRRRFRRKNQEKSSMVDDSNQTESIVPTVTTAHEISTEVLVNEQQASKQRAQHKVVIDEGEDNNGIGRTSPRVQLLIQQHLSKRTNLSPKVTSSVEDFLTNNGERRLNKKSTQPDQHASNSTINYVEPTVSIVENSPRGTTKLQRPKTANVNVNRNLTSVNAVGAPSRLSSPKAPSSTSTRKFKKKPLTITRPSSASVISKMQNSSNPSEVSTYSQTLYDGRPLSAVLQHHQRHPPVYRTVDSSCSIREAKGPTSRYNKPEELFGLKPEELFSSSDHQPKIVENQKTKDITRLKRNNPQTAKYIWQQEVDKLVDLFNIHHSSNYRPSAVPPPPPPPVTTEEDTIADLTPIGKFRRACSKTGLSNSRASLNPRLSTVGLLNVPRRNSFCRHSPMKIANT